MHKTQDLTVAELKSLLLANFNAYKITQAKLQARLQQEFGSEVQEEKPVAIAISNKLVDWFHDLLAHRLKQNQRTTPLFSSQDFVRFIPLMIIEMAKFKGEELKAEQHKMFEKFMKTTFENICEMAHAMVPPGENPYDEYWRQVTTVLDLAAERGILPTELFALEEATDEIKRRMFTKEQFVAFSKRRVNKFVDADVLKKLLVQPMLEMFADEADEEELREMEQYIETKIMPQLREIAENTKVVTNAWLDEEVERIYAVA